MKIRAFKTAARACEYLPDRDAQMVYAEVPSLTPEQYLALLNQRWRRFGYWLFRPECPSCSACRPIRVPVRDFKPNRIQRRLIKKNSQLLELQIREPLIDDEHLELYTAHHKERSESRGWRPVDSESALESILNFTVSPLPIQEWAFYLPDSGKAKLVAVAYVDQLPDGFSGIYFYHSPAHRDLSLGNWICISMIEKAKELGFDYVYFGYYVQGCISMEYKAAFGPNEIMDESGSWKAFL